jgi:hypothetical protein
LNELLGARRVSRDLDLFHDTESAVDESWQADRRLLEEHGHAITLLRERPALVEAEVGTGQERLILEWARDSAYRFFPLVQHADFGLVLHPFDLATNKVLALVGRLEVRDWVDVIECSESLQPLGFLAWAASSKDPGFSPLSILEHAGRSGRYSAPEVASLAFQGPPPDAAVLSKRWHAALTQAAEIVAALPPAESGKCVLDANGGFLRDSGEALGRALANGRVVFHAGSIRGVLPRITEGTRER